MMNYTIKQNVAVVRPDYPLSDGQDAAKLINAVRFQTGCTAMLMDRSSFCSGAVHAVQRRGGAGAQALYSRTRCGWPSWVILRLLPDLHAELYLWLQPGRPGGFWENEQEGLAWLTRKR